MVIDRLGMLGDAGQEGKRRGEIGETESPGQGIAVTRPSGGWLKVHAFPYRARRHPCNAPPRGAGKSPKEIVIMASATLDVGPLGLENPMGTDGFEFVEYAAPDPEL